jgi:hypothetical protein
LGARRRRGGVSVGLAPPFDTPAAAHSHPDCRAILTLIVAPQSGVVERCEVVAGSFFDGVPDGVDAYVLRAVIHDWDDARAGAILSNCRRAMTPEGTLLIVERVMPEKAEQGRAEDDYLLDLEMLVVTPGGRERTEAEFQAILRTAGFGPARVIPTAAPVSILEVRPA